MGNSEKGQWGNGREGRCSIDPLADTKADLTSDLQPQIRTTFTTTERFDCSCNYCRRPQFAGGGLA